MINKVSITIVIIISQTRQKL